MSWPPQKKSYMVNVAQQAFVKEKVPNIGKVPPNSKNPSGTNPLKTQHGAEIKVRETSSLSWESKKSQGKSVQTPSEETDPTRANRTAPIVRIDSLASVLKASDATTQQVEEKPVAPTSKRTFNPTSDRVDVNPNKARKAVRFSLHVDVAHYELPSPTPPEAIAEEHSLQFSDQTEPIKEKKHEVLEDKNEAGQVSFENQRESEENLQILKVESSPEIPQTDAGVQDGGAERAEHSLDNQRNQEQSEVPKDPKNPKDDASLQRSDSTKDEEISDSQMKPGEKTNSLKGSVRPAEKTPVRLGSWSKGKSPLSKLFTSGGNDRANKIKPKDTKKPDIKPGLLGRLFQSSSEKAEDSPKWTRQDETTDETPDNKPEEEKEAFRGAPPDQDDQERSTETSQPAPPNTPDEESSTLLQTCTRDDPSSVEPTSTNPLVGTEAAGLSEADTVQTGTEVSAESIAHLIPANREELLSAPSEDHISRDGVGSATHEALAPPITTDKPAKLNKLLDAPNGGNLSNSALPDLSQVRPRDPYVCSPPNPQDVLVKTTGDIFSLGDTGLLDPDFVSLPDPEPIWNETEVTLDTMDQIIGPVLVPVNQDEDHSLCLSGPGPSGPGASGPGPSGPGSRTDEPVLGLDIFQSDALFWESPPMNTTDASNQTLALLDDIFWVGDASNSKDSLRLLPSTSGAPDPPTDRPGADSSVPTDLFASDSPMLPSTGSGEANPFDGRLLASENSSHEPKAGGGWMDDLLG
ncbi:uncharacterized protein [Antennarius striatus]|uniref:uncharacterized protein n=1 Tax=Antennarius striatus TaxID=241820 RepID=UPI0035B48863